MGKCKICNTQKEADDFFCSKCGNRLKGSVLGKIGWVFGFILIIGGILSILEEGTTYGEFRQYVFMLLVVCGLMYYFYTRNKKGK